jgi:hypothetical protein
MEWKISAVCWPRPTAGFLIPLLLRERCSFSVFISNTYSCFIKTSWGLTLYRPKQIQLRSGSFQTPNASHAICDSCEVGLVLRAAVHNCIKQVTFCCFLRGFSLCDVAGSNFQTPLLKFALKTLLLWRFSYQHDAESRYGFVATCENDTRETVVTGERRRKLFYCFAALLRPASTMSRSRRAGFCKRVCFVIVLKPRISWFVQISEVVSFHLRL